MKVAMRPTVGLEKLEGRAEAEWVCIYIKMQFMKFRVVFPRQETFIDLIKDLPLNKYTNKL